VVVEVLVLVELEVEVVVQTLVARHLVPSYLDNRALVVSKYKSPSTALPGSDDAVLILPAKLKCVVIFLL
jgi:hypothetical protein